MRGGERRSKKRVGDGMEEGNIRRSHSGGWILYSELTTLSWARTCSLDTDSRRVTSLSAAYAGQAARGERRQLHRLVEHIIPCATVRRRAVSADRKGLRGARDGVRRGDGARDATERNLRCDVYAACRSLLNSSTSPHTNSIRDTSQFESGSSIIGHSPPTHTNRHVHLSVLSKRWLKSDVGEIRDTLVWVGASLAVRLCCDTREAVSAEEDTHTKTRPVYGVN
ncbi:hypothetical protein Tco_0909525 [Tanacetum coccineum]|uniref:Uncharacterized protein n=1 Tax=Tanacetum coccineum TaxID=301880 RepID=A0ABQ5CQ73_9ASTR